MYDLHSAPRSLAPELRDKLQEDMVHVVGIARGKEVDDRTLAIVGTAYLESVLTEAIAVRLPILDAVVRSTLFDPQNRAPLSDFGAKVHMARAMYVVSGVPYEDLKMIGRIRNEFAHNVRVTSFEHESIKKYLNKLKSQEREISMRKEFVEHWPWPDDTSPRGRFAVSLVTLSNGLLNASITDAGFGAACLI